MIKENWCERSWYLPNSWRVCLNFGYWFLTQPGTLIPAPAEFFLVKAWRANLLTRNSSPSRPRSVVNSIYWQHIVDQYFPVLFRYLLITKLEIYLSWSLLHLVGVDLSCDKVLFDSSFAHECVTRVQAQTYYTSLFKHKKNMFMNSSFFKQENEHHRRVGSSGKIEASLFREMNTVWIFTGSRTCYKGLVSWFRRGRRRIPWWKREEEALVQKNPFKKSENNFPRWYINDWEKWRTIR